MKIMTIMPRRDGNLLGLVNGIADVLIQFSFGFGHKGVKREKVHADSGSDEFVHSPKKLRRSLSWKSWYISSLEV